MKRITLLLVLLFSFNSYAQETQRFQVDGDCQMCKERIEETANQFDFVASSNWDKENKTLEIKFNSKNPDFKSVLKAIADVGHDNQFYKAKDEIYADLPLCCHYREDRDIREKVHLHGLVYELDLNGNKVPLEGANIYWDKTTIGTISGPKGSFLIEKVNSTDKLNLSFVGYENATVTVKDQDYVFFIFDTNKMLSEVVLTYKKDPNVVSFLSTMKIQELDEQELGKAACCSLSESFETNPTVDAISTDAVTGTRQIELLGLAGSYAQILRSNMSDSRILSSVQGLAFTPGYWIKSIQLNTGSGSVINGYESFTGQINVDLKNSSQEGILDFNTYLNTAGRTEFNLINRFKLGEHVSTSLLTHYSFLNKSNDNNKDGFLDMPLSKNLILANSWEYQNHKGLHLEFGAKYISSIKEGGTLQENTPVSWRSNIDNQKYELWSKLGRVYESGNSIGLQFSYINHELSSSFGNRNYNAKQNSIYINGIYRYVFDEHFTLNSGASFTGDKVDEVFASNTYIRDEKVYGVFGELNFNYKDKFNAILGLRYDNHNNYGGFFTPRLNLKYTINDNSVLRASVARAQRTANIFSDNLGMFASSRDIILSSNNISVPYGLNQEVAWNYGFNYSQKLGDFSLNLDYYFTDFVQQVIIDYDFNPQQVNIYELSGKSYSHSLLAQLEWKISEQFASKIAYRYNDVKIDFQNALMTKSLVAKNRAFANLAYDLNSSWKFDYTINWIGKKRLPSTASNPAAYQMEEYSPSYFLMNAQVNKLLFNNKLDIYIGVENLLDFRQEKSIISASDPIGQYFDASIIWGPILGRNIYFGLKYSI